MPDGGVWTRMESNHRPRTLEMKALRAFPGSELQAAHFNTAELLLMTPHCTGRSTQGGTALYAALARGA